jgi:AcrR family transcriptional regulator
MKYRKLMETSEQLFTQMGYKAVSMDQIAEVTGISKMTIYKHFDSKEELFVTIILDLMNKHFEVINKQLLEIPGALEKINYLLQYSLEGAKLFSLDFYKDTLSMPQIIDKILIEKNKKNKEIFEHIIIEGMEKGEIRGNDSEFIADTLITMLEVIGRKYFVNIETNEDLEKMTKNLFDFLKYGLLGSTEVNRNG